MDAGRCFHGSDFLNVAAQDGVAAVIDPGVEGLVRAPTHYSNLATSIRDNLPPEGLLCV